MLDTEDNIYAKRCMKIDAASGMRMIHPEDSLYFGEGTVQSHSPSSIDSDLTLLVNELIGHETRGE
jgi:hypothetical protein